MKLLFQRQYLPKVDYMDEQRDLTYEMRSILVDWLVDVAKEYTRVANSLTYKTSQWAFDYISSLRLIFNGKYSVKHWFW